MSSRGEVVKITWSVAQDVGPGVRQLVANLTSLDWILNLAEKIRNMDNIFWVLIFAILSVNKEE